MFQGNKTRPLSRTEGFSLLKDLAKKDQPSVSEHILSRKIKVERVIMFYLVSFPHPEHVLGTEARPCSRHGNYMQR
jgi:hypothetical protein